MIEILINSAHSFNNMFEVTLVPIVIAAIASVVFGMVWYHPKVFGTIWMRAAAITPEAQEVARKRMPLMAFFGFIASMIGAYVLNYFGIAWGVYDVVGAIELGIWVAVGFILPPLYATVLWERRPFVYFTTNFLYWLLSFVLMAIILVLLSQ